MAEVLSGGQAPYTLTEKPLGTPKNIRIVGIGAGASGLASVRALRRHLSAGSFEHVIYEKNAGVGGTWFEYRYPNCRCDIPSHNYQFSWRPNREWSNLCAPAAEINQYLEMVCAEEDMGDCIRTRHQVVGAWWDEARGVWDLSVQNLETGDEFRDHANFVIDASGVLNKWKWPAIPNLQSFEGDLIHTATWPKDFDWSNKRIAVIGNGATGIQLLPALQPAAKKLYHFVRTPTYIAPPRRMMMMMLDGPVKDMMSQIELDDQDNFTPAQIERFKNDPDLYRAFVKVTEKDTQGTFRLILNGSPTQAFAQQKVVEYMTACLGADPKLCDALIPKYPLGMRRLTPAPGYLQALRAPNAAVVTQPIAEFVPEGVRLAGSGEVVQLDAIICATGFDTSFAPRFPVVGRGGRNLQDQFRSSSSSSGSHDGSGSGSGRGRGPRSYMSVAFPDTPNWLTFFGPHGPIGHGSCFSLSEHIARYVARVIRKCQTQGIRSACPSDAAVADYEEHVAAFMPRTAWASPGGRSWFKNGEEEGPVVALHPGSRVHFFEMLEGPVRGEDWDFVYDDDDDDDDQGEGKKKKKKANRFAYLGNGFGRRETTEGMDSTWYLDEEAMERYQLGGGYDEVTGCHSGKTDEY